jgi:hypothetical protein
MAGVVCEASPPRPILQPPTFHHRPRRKHVGDGYPPLPQSRTLHSGVADHAVVPGNRGLARHLFCKISSVCAMEDRARLPRWSHMGARCPSFELVSVSIDFENTPTSVSATPPDGASEAPEDTSPLLGTASHISLALDCLQQLTLRGHSEEFIEQAIGWSLPVLA